MQASGAPANPYLPPTLDWYRQGANWLVGLSTGAIAVGLTNLAEIGSAPVYIKALCAVAGLFFLAAILSGISFYFWLTALANAFESQVRNAGKAAGESDPAKKAKLEQKVGVAEGRIERAKSWYPRLYWALMITFPAGVLLISAAILAAVTQETESKLRYTIVPMPSSASGRTEPSFDVIRFEETSGRAWILVRGPAGTPRWLEIPVAKAN